MKKHRILFLITLCLIVGFSFFLSDNAHAASARRTGTNECVLTYGNDTRDYQVGELTVWEQLTDITLTSGIGKATISGLSGSFWAGETISWSGGADTVFLGYNTTASKSTIYFTVTSGTPANGQTLSGDSSGATATAGTYTANGGCSPVLEVYDDAASFNDYVLLDGATTNSSYFRIIRPAAGQGHDGTPNNGATFISTTDASVLEIGENYSQIQDMIAKLNINSATTRNTFRIAAAYTTAAFVGCIAFDSINIGSGTNGRGFAINSGYAIDCLAHNTDGGGFYKTGANNTYLYNCTATNNSANGFVNAGNTGTTVYIRNGLASGNTTDFNLNSGTFNISYSASSDATADDWGGSGNRVSQTFSFINSGSDDFHLVSTDAGARNYGTSLASDGVYAFNDDINKGTMGAGKAGQTRSGTWDIGFDEAGVDISGTVYTDEGSANIGANKTAVLKVNGADGCGVACTAETDANGAYTISSVSIAAASNVVTVFLDGETEKATTVTRAASTTADITGLHLYQNRLIVRHEDAGPITNADLDKYDIANDSDIHFQVVPLTNSNLLYISNDTELHVWTGKSFSPGGSITTVAGGSTPGGDIHLGVNSTLTAGGSISAGGSWTADSSATFTANSKHVEFAATSTGKTITPGSSSFYDLEFISGAFDQSNDTSETDFNTMIYDSVRGFIYTGSGENGLIYRCDTSTGCDAAGDWSQVFDSPTESNFYSLLFDSANNIIYAGTGTGGIIYRCDITTTNCDYQTDWTTSYDTPEVQIRALVYDSYNQAILAGTGDTGRIYRCLTSSLCDASGDWSVAFDTSDQIFWSLTYDSTNGVLYAGSGTGGIIYYCDVDDGCESSTDWHTAYDTVQTDIYSFVFDSTNGVIYAGTSASGVIYRCATSTDCTTSGNWTISIDTPYTMVWSLVFDSVNNVIYAGTSNSGAILRCHTSSGCDADSEWTVYDTPATNIYSLIFDSANQVIYAGTGDSGIIYRSTPNNGGWTFQTNATATNNFAIVQGTVIGPVSGQLTIGGNYSNSATFTHNSSTIIFNKSSGTQTLNSGGTGSGKIFYGLTHSGAGTLQLVTNQIHIDGAFNNSSGTFDAGTNSLNQTFSGNFTNSATFTPGSTTATFDSTSTQQVNAGGTAAGKSFNALTHSGSGGTLQLATTGIDVNGAFSQTAGTFDCNSQNQNFAGSFSISGGSWTKGGTLTFDGSSQTFSDTTASDMGAVTIGPSTATSLSTSSAMKVTTITTGADDTLDISGDTLTILGGGTPFTEGGTFTVTGSTVIYAGSSATNVTTTQYNNLTFTPSSGTPTYSLTGHLTGSNVLLGNLTISANATLDTTGSNYDITFPGNWANSGAFTANNGTVTLSGAGASTQEISGDNTFYNLTAQAASARTLKFESDKTQAITNTLDIDGSSGQLITLTTITGTTPWKINPTAAATVTYVDVNYSNDIGAAICAAYSQSTNDNNSGGWTVTANPSCNASPDTPTNLGPAGYIDAAGWTGDNTPTFNFDITDPDPSEQVKYRIQIDDSSDFLSLVLDYQPSSYGAEGTYYYTVGQAGSYAVGSESMTLSDSASGGGYYWRVKAIDDSLAESSYEVAGVDLTIDFRVDATAPTGGTVNDGTSGDDDWNDGSLTQISGNWTGFNADTSGLQKYEYAIRREPDDYYWDGDSWESGQTWNDNGTDTDFTNNSMNLQTGVMYYVSVKTTDNAGNTASAVDSDGQQVLPTLSFTLGSTSITFANLNDSNSWTDTETMTTTTSTNASNGYTIKAHETQLLTSLPYPSQTISNFTGTWSDPLAWGGGTYGFGYTSTDPSVQGSNRFNDATEYAAFSQTAPGDVAADHTDAVNGSTGAVSSEVFTITYKVSASPTQAASEYQTYVIYIVTANY